MKPETKKRKITADQIARGLNYFEELGVPFVAVFEGVPAMFGNVPHLHLSAILEAQYLLNIKVAELRVEKQAEKQTMFSDGD